MTTIHRTGTTTNMTASRSPKRSGPSGVKVLITAASLAATVGGWATLSAKEGLSSATQPTTPITPTSAAATVSLDLPPLPTLVPAPAQQPVIITSNRPPVSSGGQRPAAASAPAPAPAPGQGLRVVSAPPVQVGGGGGSVAAPAPVTNTRSSR